MFEQGQSGSSDRSTEFELANNEHWEPSRDSSAPDSSCPAVKKYRSTPPRANPPRPDILLLLLEKETERERDPSKSVARERKAGEKDSVSGGSRVGVLSRSKFRRRGNGRLTRGVGDYLAVEFSQPGDVSRISSSRVNLDETFRSKRKRKGERKKRRKTKRLKRFDPANLFIVSTFPAQPRR